MNQAMCIGGVRSNGGRDFVVAHWAVIEVDFVGPGKRRDERMSLVDQAMPQYDKGRSYITKVGRFVIVVSCQESFAVVW